MKRRIFAVFFSLIFFSHYNYLFIRKWTKSLQKCNFRPYFGMKLRWYFTLHHQSKKNIVIIQMKWFQFVLRIKFKRENDSRSSDAILSSCEKKPGKKKIKLRRDSSLCPPWYWFAQLPIGPFSPNWNFYIRVMIRLLNRNEKLTKIFLVLNVWLRSSVAAFSHYLRGSGTNPVEASHFSGFFSATA